MPVAHKSSSLISLDNFSEESYLSHTVTTTVSTVYE